MTKHIGEVQQKGRVASWNKEADGSIDYGESDGTGNASVTATKVRYNRRKGISTFENVYLTVVSGYEGWSSDSIVESLLRGMMA